MRKVQLRGPRGTAKQEGESYTLGEQIQYTDIWANDNCLQFMYKRLLLLRELMAETATIWMQCDLRRGHYLKCTMDEVFGNEHVVNQVVWERPDTHSDVGQGAKHLGTIHDTMLLYSRGVSYTWNDLFSPLPEATVEKWYRNVEPGTGRRYNKADITGPGGAVKDNPVYEWRGITQPWRFSKERMARLDEEGRIVYTESGMPYQRRYLDESRGVPMQDVWEDIAMVRGIQRRDEGAYPTEKPELLIQRVLEINSNPGDLVLACCAGSGTAAAVAQKLGRRWIACDTNEGALQTTAKRLQTIMEMQRQDGAQQTPSLQLDEQVVETGAPPAQLGFTVWRGNDCGLAIQHNEAVNLACEHIGIERTRSDSHFDGVRRKKLVKIIPFGHALSPLDLEELKRELEARPDEDREITVVCQARNWPRMSGWRSGTAIGPARRR